MENQIKYPRIHSPKKLLAKYPLLRYSNRQEVEDYIFRHKLMFDHIEKVLDKVYNEFKDKADIILEVNKYDLTQIVIDLRFDEYGHHICDYIDAVTCEFYASDYRSDGYILVMTHFRRRRRSMLGKVLKLILPLEFPVYIVRRSDDFWRSYDTIYESYGSTFCKNVESCAFRVKELNEKTVQKVKKLL